MQTVQTTNVLTVATSLTTETLCVGTVLDGQILLVEDDVTIDIGDGNLSSRNQIEVVDLAVIHLTFLVRQLTSTIARGGVYYCRRHDLRITGLIGFSEEEIDEGSLQLGSLADIDGETCACDLHAEIEVDEVVLLGEFPVGQGIGDTQ